MPGLPSHVNCLSQILSSLPLSFVLVVVALGEPQDSYLLAHTYLVCHVGYSLAEVIHWRIEVHLHRPLSSPHTLTNTFY